MLDAATHEDGTPPLDDARSRYIDELDRFRFQLYVKRGKPGDYERVGESSQTYMDSVRTHLLGGRCLEAAGSTSLGQLTVEEIATRRRQIATRFQERPLEMDANIELVLGFSALVSLARNSLTGHIPSTLGSGLLAATSYFNFKYRRDHPLIDDSIEDSALLEHAMQDLGTSTTTTDEQCMRVVDATVQSERAAVTRMAAQILAARTYTPFGFLRLAGYNFQERRRAKKAASASDA